MTDLQKKSELNRQLLQNSARETKELLEGHYYKSWDCGVKEARTASQPSPVTGAVETHAKLFFLYQPGAQIVWNGHHFTSDKIDQLVGGLSEVAMKHELDILNVQPMDETHSVATVHGRVTYDHEVTRGFVQTFIVWRQRVGDKDRNRTDKYWIVHDNFRWTSSET
ncbi:nuclear transport factor 2 protein(NFT2) [Diplonema papillatum]|nr:nuclear transport factor 2 protein(NFT2) [Diplonema papillatum]